MAYEAKDGQITVWKNEKFVMGGNQPYAKGKGKDHNGTEVEITLWIPKSDKIKGFNLTIGAPYVKAENNEPPMPAPEGGDDLPF